MEGNGRGQFKAILRHLFKGTEENCNIAGRTVAMVAGICCWYVLNACQNRCRLRDCIGLASIHVDNLALWNMMTWKIEMVV